MVVIYHPRQTKKKKEESKLRSLLQPLGYYQSPTWVLLAMGPQNPDPKNLIFHTLSILKQPNRDPIQHTLSQEKMTIHFARPKNQTCWAAHTHTAKL